MKSTLSQALPCQTFTSYPGFGVADTSRATLGVSARMTRPPGVTYVWSRLAEVAEDEGEGEGDAVATVEESPGGGELGRGCAEGRSPTTGRGAEGPPKTAPRKTGRAANQTSSMASVVAPPQTNA